VDFTGTCDFFNVSNGGSISITGSDGYADTSSPGPYNAYIPLSQGGDAVLNVTATEGLKIENSTFDLRGGDGFDLPASTNDYCNAWTYGSNLDGHVAAGGNATAYLDLIPAGATMVINNSTLDISGAHGGNAVDGGDGVDGIWERGLGGGYSNMGNVQGFVGAGGSATIFIVPSDALKFYQTNINLYGGNGGLAGDGGDGWLQNAGGGGGYSGGDSTTDYGLPGGDVTGNVGTGGSVISFIDSTLMDAFRLNMIMNGGNGGDAGNGGMGGYACGGGGAGYGGGGGAENTYGSAPDSVGGDGGLVSDRVGAGGDVRMEMDNLYSRLVECDISALGGNGGLAGNGGDGDNPNDTPSGGEGGGGGGYGGGGGAGHDTGGGVGGSTTVMGNVGCGGNSEILLNGYDTLISIDSVFSVTGGNGGNGGTGGTGDESGGGGGYGGAGGSCLNSAIGGQCTLSGNIGDGGSADYLIQWYSKPSVSDTTSITTQEGLGGIAPDSPGSGLGGEGEGRTTSDGVSSSTIPMSVPLLISPANDTSVLTNPTFVWMDMHDSTTNGLLVDYTIEVDNNGGFPSPEHTLTTPLTNYTPVPPLTDGYHVWRVRANYQNPPGSSSEWSQWRCLYFDGPKQFNISFSEGWNLFSLPLVPEDTAIDEVLLSIWDQWDYIMIYETLNPQPWVSNNKDRFWLLNHLWELNHTVGIWINITEPGVTLMVNGTDVSTSIPLYAGWNLVSYPTLNDTVTVMEALAGTGYDMPAVGYNASEPYRIGPLADTYVMQPGEAYWVHVPFDTVLLVDW
jgi:hypothetical protein